MIYLFSGDDAKNRISAYEKFSNSEVKELEVFLINNKNFNETEIENFYSGNSLFFKKCVVVFREILDISEHRDFILNKLSQFADSSNLFVFIEGKLNKPIIDAFKKVNAEIKLFELIKIKKERFNNFLIANAFESGDKVNCWLNYRLAIDKGVGIEEVAGVLFWKVKDMILNKRFNKFKENKLKNLANELSFLLPNARRDGRDVEMVMEKFLLEAF